MISDNFDSPIEGEGNKSVTVTIDDSGKINVDQEVLKSILESNQQSATVTFVRIGEEDPSPPFPLPEEGCPGDIILDTEEMTRLEKVLRSDEAKDFLSTVLAQTPTLITESSPLSSGQGLGADGAMEATVLLDVVQPPEQSTENTIIFAEEQIEDPSRKEDSKMTRRSQRQLDKEIKEEAERIRLENQALMRKEDMAATPVAVIPEAPGGRPKRERKVPAHLITGDYESSLLPTLLHSEPSPPKAPAMKRSVSAGKVGPPPSSDEEEDSGDWNSEDDPERLWCVCNQPHNNRFMICCDSCLDWFHGKCVGITKKMGKDMEEASIVWKCPKCAEENKAKEAPKAVPSPIKKPPSAKVKKDVETASPKKKAPPEPEKKKERSCYVCEKPPRASSIFCSDECISKHALKAKALLQKSRPKDVSPSPSSFTPHTKNTPSSLTQISADKTQVLVIEPNTNTMLNGPHAPTEGTLESWLLSHPTFHVVLPRSLPTSKFYGTKKALPSTTTSKSTQQQSSGSNKSLLLISPDGSRAKKSPSQQQQTLSAEEMREAEIKKVHKSLQQHIMQKEYIKSPKTTTNHGSHKVVRSREKLSSSVNNRSKSPPQRKTTSSMISSTSSPPPSSISASSSVVNPKPIRANAVKGLSDALKARLAKVTDVQIGDEDLNKLVGEIEESLFRYYNKDVTSKYKAKYRSLVFNIKDEKNTGFFRKIVSRKISSKELVSLTPEDMANKELQRWREKELKNDIEKIKSHELDMIKLGSKFVMKSHKGEIAIEGEEAVAPPLPVGANPPLPEEINEPSGITVQRKKDVIEGPKTWDHGTHEFEPTCDVCNGKKTLEEFLTIKIAKEAKEDKNRRNKDESSSTDKKNKHSSKRSHSKERDRRHSSSKHRRRSRSKDSKKERTKDGEDGKKETSRKSSTKQHSRHRENRKESSSSHTKSKSSSSSHDESRNKSRSKDSSSRSSHHSSSKEVSKKSLEEIWSSRRKDDEPPKDNNPSVTPPDSSETNKKIQEAQKTIESAIKSSIPEIATTPPKSSDEVLVSSTVTIKTPESVSTESSPIVWKGDLNMPDVAKFSVTAHQVSGTTDYLTVDLKPLLKIVGRIDPGSVWEYITKMKESPNKEVLLVRLEPTTEDERAPYVSFFNYLQNRNRFGVVGESTGKTVKDCYILPLGATQTVHSCMLPYEGPGLDFLKSDMLLALIVRGKRKRAHDDYQPSSSQSYSQPKNKAKMTEPKLYPSTNPRKRDLVGASYDPLLPIKSNKTEEEDVYDPEIAFLEEDSSPKKLKTEEDPKFSDEEDITAIASPPPRPLTSSGGGFTEKLALLTAEIEMQKKEINSIESSMKVSEPSRDPRHKAPAPSTLSNMTDEDLMAKAQEMLDMEKETPPLREDESPAVNNNMRAPPPFIAPPPSSSSLQGSNNGVWAGNSPWNGNNQSNNSAAVWNQKDSGFKPSPWAFGAGPSWYEGTRGGWGGQRHGGGGGNKRSSPQRNYRR